MIELLRDGDVRLSRAHRSPTSGRISRSEIRVVLDTAREAFDELLQLWEASRP